MSLYSFRSSRTEVSIIPRRELFDHRPNSPSTVSFANSVLVEIRELPNERNESTKKATSLYSVRSQQDFINKGCNKEHIRIKPNQHQPCPLSIERCFKTSQPLFGLPPSTTFFHMIIPLQFRYLATSQQVLILPVGAHF